MNSNLSAELRGISAEVSAIMAAVGTLTPESLESALFAVEVYLDRIAADLDNMDVTV